MTKHTEMPLTYQMEYTGDDWLVASVDFGMNPDGDNVTGWITTDHVHASEVDYGDPEADLRLWSKANTLLYNIKKLLYAEGELTEKAYRRRLEEIIKQIEDGEG